MPRTGSPASSPLLLNKAHAAPSVFRPENLLREARRQRQLPDRPVPDVCVLDPDGDLVRHLRATGQARPSPGWACYHTVLDEFTLAGRTIGAVGCAVGAPFAVLVAEQLFASGCRLLLSITSAGQIVASGPTPYFVLIERALRDEGTSHHYLPMSAYAEADAALVDAAARALGATSLVVHRGATWTTDAPYRETIQAIEAARELDILAVEMEAAALYAFAQAAKRPVLCFAHVTNQMAQAGDDFEKGAENGAADALALISAVSAASR